MAMTTRERTQLRDELTGQGYHWDYIDEWQPKVSLYRHRAMVSPSGEVVSEVGTRLENLPGSPDYVSRKARQGLLTWPPSDTCTCRWCAERNKQFQLSGKEPVAKVAETAPEPVMPQGRGKRRMGPHFKTS